MAFFPCKSYNTKSYNTNASFMPLFRLLEDFDSHYNEAPRRTVTRWVPKFDVRETEHAFELHGELPGLNKEDVHLKFTEPQTLLIRGKSERTYTTSAAVDTPAPEAAPATPAAPVEEPAVSKDDDAASQSSKRSSYQATVEDEFEDISYDGGETIAEEKSHTEEAAPKEPEQLQPEVQPEVKDTAPNAKYWLTERSIGEFARSFHFPRRVDQEAVTANFQDGILTIVVPKAKKQEFQRIIIF